MSRSAGIFISHASADSEAARTITRGLEGAGIACWLASRDAAPGASWGDEIAGAIASCRAVVLLLSESANASVHVRWEIKAAAARHVPVITCRLTRVAPDERLGHMLTGQPWMDGFALEEAGTIERLAAGIRQLFTGSPPEAAPVQAPHPAREDRSRGYIFISYVRSDTDFVKRLRGVFESRKFGYWDYIVGSRDYHGALYRELEERIDGAVAFMTIVSDEWRGSDWVASEFVYAREAGIPIFVIQAKPLARPLPILLNLQTRIDMSGDWTRATETLVQELERKSL